jgi:hypothetical protein
MKSILENLRDMEVGTTTKIKDIGWRVNKVISSIANLHKCSDQEYLIDGRDNLILVTRIK